MRRLVKCPGCGAMFEQNFPDVTPEQAEQLRAEGKDLTVMIKCTNCKQPFQLHQWSLPELPEP